MLTCCHCQTRAVQHRKMSMNKTKGMKKKEQTNSYLFLYLIIKNFTKGKYLPRRQKCWHDVEQSSHVFLGLICKFYDSPSLSFFFPPHSLPLDCFHMVMDGQLCGPTAWNSSPQRRNGDGRREERKGQTDRGRESRQKWADAHQRAKSPS